MPNPLDLAGAGLGSLLSAFWLKESLAHKAVFLVGGWVFALGASPQLAPRLHLDGFMLTFLLGLASMSFFAKCLETWQRFPLGTIVRDFARKWAGLPPAVSTVVGGLTGTTKPTPLRD